MGDPLDVLQDRLGWCMCGDTSSALEALKAVLANTGPASGMELLVRYSLHALGEITHGVSASAGLIDTNETDALRALVAEALR